MTDSSQVDQGTGPGDEFGFRTLFDRGRDVAPTVLQFVGPVASASRFASEGQRGSAELLGGAMQFVDLGLGLANLGLSTAIYAEVKAIRCKLDEVGELTRENQMLLRDIADKIDRIDVNVAENNLRHAVKHNLGRAIQDERIDLRRVALLHDDLLKFAESIGGGFYLGCAPGLRLSSDLREMLIATDRLLSGVRTVVVAEHNMRVGGDPTLIYDDYGPIIDFVSAVRVTSSTIAVAQMFPDAAEFLGDHVYNKFTFASESDRDFYANWVSNDLATQLLDGIAMGTPWGQLGLLLLPAAPVVVDGEPWSKLVDFVESYLLAWGKTDAGALYELLHELEYYLPDSEIWAQLDPGTESTDAVEWKVSVSSLREANLVIQT